MPQLQAGVCRTELWPESKSRRFPSGPPEGLGKLAARRGSDDRFKSLSVREMIHQSDPRITWGKAPGRARFEGARSEYDRGTSIQ